MGKPKKFTIVVSNNDTSEFEKFDCSVGLLFADEYASLLTEATPFEIVKMIALMRKMERKLVVNLSAEYKLDPAELAQKLDKFFEREGEEFKTQPLHKGRASE